VTPIESQIEQMESLATRHYPEDAAERNACLVRLLTERLRMYHAMYAGKPVAPPAPPSVPVDEWWKVVPGGFVPR
jgi:hypothetical protein